MGVTSELKYQLEVSAAVTGKLSDQVMKKSVACLAVLVAVVSASYPPPPFYGPAHRGGYGGASGLGGLDPLTLLLLQKDGGFGGNGGISSLLPPLLSGGLGGGKKGGLNPLMLALLSGKCVEKYPPGGCVQPATANANPDKLCGDYPGYSCNTSGGSNFKKCLPCCTCPTTTENVQGWKS